MQVPARGARAIRNARYGRWCGRLNELVRSLGIVIFNIVLPKQSTTSLCHVL